MSDIVSQGKLKVANVRISPFKGYLPYKRATITSIIRVLKHIFRSIPKYFSTIKAIVESTVYPILGKIPLFRSANIYLPREIVYGLSLECLVEIGAPRNHRIWSR